ncbi:hypothetical protein QTP70_016825, partial [Hemibagrus guttatus]
MHSSKQIVKFADDTTVVGLISKNDESAREQSDHSPLFIDGSPMEIIKSTKFLGVHLEENFTWSLNTTSITKKAQQHLYCLWRLRKAHLSPHILTMFYRRNHRERSEQLHHCLVWELHHLRTIVRTAEKIIGVSPPSITYTIRCIRKANNNPTHPSQTLVTLLLSGK